LYGGSWSQLENSIKSRIYTLDEGIKVYPGHGMDTTIGFERENNPYV
jgi:glyoxylase-like metal-dependent hydrolase (beta-lactamase superfamily II)